MRFLNGTRVPRKQGAPLITSGSLTITCLAIVFIHSSAWIGRWARPNTPDPLLQVQINNAVLGGLHFDSDVNILLPGIVEPSAVCQRTKRRHFGVLAILKLHARRPLEIGRKSVV